MEFGYRYVMALSIRDQGFNCPDVKDVEDVGYEWEGVVMKVTCGPFGAQAGLGRPPAACHRLYGGRLHHQSMA